MRGFLLESHVPFAVVTGVKRRLPDCVIEHLSEWRGGKLLNADYETILAAAQEEQLVLVTYDRNTITPLVRAWIEEARPLAGVAFIASRSIISSDVGGLISALTELYSDPDRLDPAWPILYLHLSYDR